ncbi:MAG: sulfotransferase domain-containing protein [Candidatus Paceibacteria bacterium]
MSNQQKKQLVYIYGLGYSGSTILNILLGAHPNIVGIGEFYASFNEVEFSFGDRICSCGVELPECEFWKQHQSLYQERKNDSLGAWQGYKKIIDSFYENNPNKILIDSSKRRDYFRELYNKTQEDDSLELKVIYLLRDVRGFSVSLRKRRENRGKWGNSFLYQLGWWHRQKKFKRVLEQIEIDFLQLGYEELILKNTESLEYICDFLDLEQSERLQQGPSKSSSHAISGNPMRTKSRKKELKYDFKWFHDYGVNLSYSLLPFVAQWNEKEVYDNLR